MKVFYRWVPKAHAQDAIRAKLLSHSGSATWIFDATQPYRPGVLHGAVLIAFELDSIATQNVTTREHMNFEDDGFHGEAAHPRNIIVKDNERGAYGLGRMRQAITNPHVTARYATKSEVAKVLNVREIDDRVDKHKPDVGWPRLR